MLDKNFTAAIALTRPIAEERLPATKGDRLGEPTVSKCCGLFYLNFPVLDDTEAWVDDIGFLMRPTAWEIEQII